MKSIILPFLLCLFCCSISEAQSRYDLLMSEGKSAFENLEYSKAISKFKAAKISSNDSQIKEADKQIELANNAFIEAIQQANEETKLALEQSKLEAKISEANRLAFMANQYVEKENYSEAFQIATIAMSMVEDDPTNLVEKAFGDAGYRHFSKEMTNTNGVVLNIKNTVDGKVLIHSRNQAPVLLDPSGNLVNRLTGHQQRIIAVAVSSIDGSIATCSEDGIINFWNHHGKLNKTIKIEEDGIYATQLITSPTGNTIAVLNDFIIKVFSKKGEEIHSIREAHKITNVSCSSDGKQLLTCTVKGAVKLWDASTMTLMKELINVGNYIHQAIFTNDGSKIIIAPEGQAALVFDNTGKQLFTLKSEYSQTGFYEITCSPDNKKMALATKNEGIEIWNLNGQFINKIKRQTDKRTMLHFSPNGKKILSIDKEDTFMLWDLESKKSIFFDQHKGALTALCFSPDGNYILSAAKDHTAKLWKTDGSLVMNQNRHENVVRMALFSEEGSHIITGGADAKVFRSSAYHHILEKINNEALAELTAAQKQKWGLK